MNNVRARIRAVVLGVENENINENNYPKNGNSPERFFAQVRRVSSQTQSQIWRTESVEFYIDFPGPV